MRPRLRLALLVSAAISLIVDDPHNIADVENPKLLENTIDKFLSMVVHRLDNRKKGRIMIVGHRVHEKDLSGDLLEGGGWKHLALPIIAPTDQTLQHRVWSLGPTKG